MKRVQTCPYVTYTPYNRHALAYSPDLQSLTFSRLMKRLHTYRYVPYSPADNKSYNHRDKQINGTIDLLSNLLQLSRWNMKRVQTCPYVTYTPYNRHTLAYSPDLQSPNIL